MKIIADENIPYAREAFQTLGTVRLMPGREIGPEDVQSADVLLVRSVTRVDRELIRDARLKFVGSATIGTDHVDRAYLAERGIPFAHAPGCNADSVVEYVLAALFVLARRHSVALEGKTVGIVGCGNIGGRLAVRLEALGFNVLKNDPPLADEAGKAGIPHDYLPLDQVLAEADVLTLHVPLTRSGPYATYHLFDDVVLSRLKPGAWLINSCRGAVVDNQALLNHVERGHIGAVVLDVWENEPTPSPELLKSVDLATPHIAGYSYDGKINGTIMLYRDLARLFGQDEEWDYDAALASTPEDHPELTPPEVSGGTGEEWADGLIRQMYDIEADDRRMRAMLERPADEHAKFFSDLRKTYPRRRSFQRHYIRRSIVPEVFQQRVESGLRVQLVD